MDRGPEFIAIEMALIKKDGAVKEDLIKRGLFSYPVKDGPCGELKVGEIKKLINDDVYFIDNTGTLELSSKRSKLNTSIQQDGTSKTTTTTYKKVWMQNYDGFYYRGHKAYVDIPASITLNPYTTHAAYCHGLVAPNEKWVESGVGWVGWDQHPGPILFTYDDYIKTWRYRSITGGVSRTIYLELDIIPDPPYGGLAWMYAYDSYDNVSIGDYRAVPTMNFIAAQQQEQTSDYSTWTMTPGVEHHDNYLKDSSATWIDWDNSIVTHFHHDTPPMYYSDGIRNNRRWIYTWCNY